MTPPAGPDRRFPLAVGTGRTRSQRRRLTCRRDRNRVPGPRSCSLVNSALAARISNNLDDLGFSRDFVPDQQVVACAPLRLDELVQRDGAVHDICHGQAGLALEPLEILPGRRNQGNRDSFRRRKAVRGSRNVSGRLTIKGCGGAVSSSVVLLPLGAVIMAAFPPLVIRVADLAPVPPRAVGEVLGRARPAPSGLGWLCRLRSVPSCLSTAWLMQLYGTVTMKATAMLQYSNALRCDLRR